MTRSTIRASSFEDQIRELATPLAQERDLAVLGVQWLPDALELIVTLGPSCETTDNNDLDYDQHNLDSDLCGDLSVALSERMETLAIEPPSGGRPYTLQVSSQGASQELRSQKEFNAFRGFEVDVGLSSDWKKPGERELNGILVRRTPQELILTQRGRPLKIPRDIVAFVRLKDPIYED